MGNFNVAALLALSLSALRASRVPAIRLTRTASRVHNINDKFSLNCPLKNFPFMLVGCLVGWFVVVVVIGVAIVAVMNWSPSASVLA